MHDLTEPFLRLLAAAVVGTVIGINRDLYGKPTGVRLHSLVSIASALLVMLAGELGTGTPDHAAASRIIQGRYRVSRSRRYPPSRQGEPCLSHHDGSHDLGDGSPWYCLWSGGMAGRCSRFSSRACRAHFRTLA
jgi:hypothetical protein